MKNKLNVRVKFVKLYSEVTVMSTLQMVPTDVISASVLALRRLNLRMSVCKDMRRLIVIMYLYETVNKVDKHGYNTVYTVINGFKHGITRRWYESGEIEYEIMYKNGNLHGLSRVWYESGQLLFERMYKNGKKDGISRRWYESGQLWYERMYKDGEHHGLVRGWYITGQLEYVRMYKNGREI